MFLGRKFLSIVSPRVIVMIAVMVLSQLAAGQGALAAARLSSAEALSADFVKWYYSHKDTGGTYKLTDDLIVDGDEYNGLSLPFDLKPGNGARIDIDAGPHSFIVNGNITLCEGIYITGQGGQRGVVRAERVRPDWKVVLSIRGAEITATDGTAVYVSENAKSFDILESEGANFTVIRAGGDNARCIDSRLDDILVISKSDMEAKGNRAVAIEAAGSLDISYSKISAANAEGGLSGCQSVKTVSSVYVSGSQIMPLLADSPLNSVDNGFVLDTVFLDVEPITVALGTDFEQLKLPKQAKLCRSYDTWRVTAKILWDVESYRRNAQSGTSFVLTGTFDVGLGAEAVKVDESLKASVPITFTDSSPGPQTSVDNRYDDDDEDYGGIDDSKDKDKNNDDFSGTRGGGGLLTTPERESENEAASAEPVEEQSGQAYVWSGPANGAPAVKDAANTEESGLSGATLEPSAPVDAAIQEQELTVAEASVPSAEDTSDSLPLEQSENDTDDADDDEPVAAKAENHEPPAALKKTDGAKTLKSASEIKGSGVSMGIVLPAGLIALIFAAIVIVLNPKLIEKLKHR